MNKQDIVKILMELIDEKIFTPKENGFARFIGKSGIILLHAYSGADENNLKLLLKRFPDINKIVEITQSHTKSNFCRVVAGAYMMGLSADEIEIGCKAMGIWK